MENKKFQICTVVFYVVVLGILLTLNYQEALAQAGPVSTSLAGPTNAKVGINPELMLSNPAAISAEKNVYMGTIATFGNNNRLDLTRNISLKNSYTAYVIDRGSDLLFPLSLFYTRSYLDIQNPTAPPDMSSIYVATVIDISQALSIGGGYYRNEVQESSSSYLKLGAVYNISETMSFGASYHQNLLNNNNSDNAISIGGKVLVLNRTAIYLDFTRRSWAYSIRDKDSIADRNSMISLGIENKISNFLVRLGANTPFSKNIKDTYFSCGIGYEGPKIGLDYGLGYHKPVTNDPNESIHNFTHGFNLNIFF